MLRALYSAAAGMNSQQLNLDVISNNLANVNTTGYKKSKIEFQELLYQTTRAAGSEQGGGNQLPTGLQIGQGSGFFEVQNPDGTRSYTRDGAFKTAADGRIVTSDGLPLQGGFQPVPAGT